jgi:outer membrane protein OmpA-like peptidoglycan-associated protein
MERYLLVFATPSVWPLECISQCDMRLFKIALYMFLPVILCAQDRNPLKNTPQPADAQSGANPIFRVEVVSRSIAAVSYQNRAGWTKVDFQGTSLAPAAKGTAEINSRLGHMEVKVDIKGLPAARQFGPLYLTYVLWAITPEGHSANLGEVVVNSDGNFKADVTTDLQAFGLIVTAEPYYAVPEPSDVVVMENIIRTDTVGKQEVVNANYQLLPRGQYEYHVPESQIKPVGLNANKKSPLELYEAINAVQIAQYAKADQFAGDTLTDASKLLQQAQDYQDRKQWNPAIMTAKEAVQKAEDARTISLRTQQKLALEHEREVAAAKVAASQAEAQAQAQQRAQADALARQAQEQARVSAEQARLAAEQKTQADQARQEADAARAEAAAQALKAQQAAAEADRLRQAAEMDKEKLRAQLLQQFNTVLPTTETARGLVVNMQDVLFDTGKYTLKPAAREALAKISGIVISHPGLNLQVEGYTDSTGTPEFNQKLSEERASTVRDFLGAEGLNPQSMTSIGYGMNYPVAPNDTAAGRKLNRRVELVVSGEVIGVKIGTPPTASAQPMTMPMGTPAH